MRQETRRTAHVRPVLGLLGLAVLLALLAAPAEAAAPVVEVSGGVHEVLQAGDVAEGGLELQGRALRAPHLPRFVPGLVPIAGVIASEDGAVYGYAGFALEFRLTRRFTVTPNWALGAYGPGERGRDLGGLVEFRSALDLSYAVGPRTNVGVSFYHLSNAGIYERNPGTESLVVTYGFAPW